MEMPLAEIVDRYTILKLKSQRIDRDTFAKELSVFEAALLEFRDRGFDIKEEWIQALLETNGRIWDLEADIRSGKEGKLGLEEVGRRAIAIRNINNERVAIKNRIAQHSGTGFLEKKVDHASSDD